MELAMYAYTPNNPVELEIESGRSRLDYPKYEVLIISVADVQIALGFVLGTLTLLVASRPSEDT
jgi:hypothetical protein